MSSSTLAANISSLGDVLQEYFQVLITNFWPILLGILILTAVVGVVYWGIKKLFSMR